MGSYQFNSNEFKNLSTDAISICCPPPLIINMSLPILKTLLFIIPSPLKTLQINKAKYFEIHLNLAEK